MPPNISEKFDALISLWRSKPKSACGAPLRKELDWTDFSDFYGWVIIYEVEAAGLSSAQSDHKPRIINRMIGTNITRIQKSDYTGKYLNEVFDRETYPFVFEPIEQAIAEMEPVTTDHAVPVLGGYDMRLQKLLLPFSSNGDRVDHIWGVLYYTSLGQKIE